MFGSVGASFNSCWLYRDDVPRSVVLASASGKCVTGVRRLVAVPASASDVAASPESGLPNSRGGHRMPPWLVVVEVGDTIPGDQSNDLSARTS